MEQINIRATGRAYPASHFGVADAKFKFHIAQVRQIQEGNNPPTETFEPGTGPFTVKVYKDYNDPTLRTLVKTVTGIPVCQDPGNWNIREEIEPCEFNSIIEDMAAGHYQFIIEDGSMPEPLDLRLLSDWFAPSPPFVTIRGSVNPMGRESMVRILYSCEEDGTGPHTHEVGTYNGYGEVPVNALLPTALDENAPEGFIRMNRHYFGRIVVENDLGVFEGPEFVFNTIAPPVIKNSPPEIIL